MTRSYLSFYLILLLLPLLYSCRLNLPLLHGYKKLDPTEEEDPRTLLLADHLTDFQAGKHNSNRENAKSLFQTTKVALTHLFVTKTQTPDGQSMISWKLWYDNSHKVSESSASAGVQEMAEAVLKFGPQFDRHQHNPEREMEYIMSTIDLFSRSLEDDKLSAAERIWSVGVLSYLRARLPEEKKSVIPSLWTAEDLRRPREQFLLFFLGDKDLRPVARQMWSEFPTEVESSERVIQEAIQRGSIVHLVKKQTDMIHNEPPPDFQELFLAFINLKTPIKSQKALSLIDLIKKQLNEPQTKNWNRLDEESNTVRLFLHLEEYHYEIESCLGLEKLIRIPNIREQILKNAISLQLATEKLHPVFRNLLIGFEKTKLVDSHRVTKVLELLKQEQIPITQLGRLFRVINLVLHGNKKIYKSFILQLDEHSEMIPKLFEILFKYRYVRMNPQMLPWQDRYDFIFTTREEQTAEKYRNDLGKLLITKGVFTSHEIIRDIEYLNEPSKKTMVTATLYGIFKKISRSRRITRKEHTNTDWLTAEYILHLISFKNNDKILYRHLRHDQHVPEKVPEAYTLFFKEIGDEIFRFIDNAFGDDDGNFDTFAKALKELENSFFFMIWKTDRSRYENGVLKI
ncbi:uncharacterized protein MELLADRAFT_113015 [Melampsora larici-populina 98AG31]|uniref:Secreted protein n=1 Tax=Melampsora larici-populina (strain 98AG31 / pathotype 3-4-7) TaxID=747676 RepID=F4S8F1_MELLP|nr:uncharacterized protein MELLADRAFT_113015 [Melampsora larici-populina 98AG31]EGF99101.1 hypothetical protein MELLADRAFT_113015 [Melampsora larici-populina 98AG31]